MKRTPTMTVAGRYRFKYVQGPNDDRYHVMEYKPAALKVGDNKFAFNDDWIEIAKVPRTLPHLVSKLVGLMGGETMEVTRMRQIAIYWEKVKERDKYLDKVKD